MRNRRIAGTKIRHEGRTPDAHDVIGRHRWDGVRGIHIRQHGDRDRMGGMQMHDGAGVVPGLKQRRVQWKFLGGGISRDEPARVVETAQACGIEETERRVRRGRETAAIARRTEMLPDDPARQAALEKGAAEPADVFPKLGFFAQRSLPWRFMSGCDQPARFQVTAQEDSRVLDRVLYPFPCFLHVRVQHF